jgi:hypothetical protein
MPSLSPKENYLRALRQEEYEYVPYWQGGVGGLDVVLWGFLSPIENGQPQNNYIDGYGVRWAGNDSVVGARTPAPGEFILKDITRWKTTLTMPRVDSVDWQKLGEEEAALWGIDRDKQALAFFGSGIWLRISALMGFEEAMIALVEEPDACNDLFTAITDLDIQQLEKAAQYWKPDVFYHGDDIATDKNPFMSPETYRVLIKPHHKRLYDAAKNLGMIPVQHTCGHAESLVEDFIEIGAAAWSSVQISNDIAGLLDKYGSQILIEGGFDSTGKPGRPDATVAEVVAETERCFREYGNKKGFIFWPVLIGSNDTMAGTTEKIAALMETTNRLRFAGK